MRADWQRARALAGGSAAACVASPGFQAVATYRFGRWLLSQPITLRLALEPLYRLAYFFVLVLWGIELPRRAQIGAGLVIAHSGGIVISQHAVIGSNCNLSHQVTIGLGGRGSRGGVPVIGDDAYIAPGAKLFGRIRIGNNVAIGANAVVSKDIPDNAIVVLDPGFAVVSYKGNRRRAAPGGGIASVPSRSRAA